MPHHVVLVRQRPEREEGEETDSQGTGTRHVRSSPEARLAPGAAWVVQVLGTREQMGPARPGLRSLAPCSPRALHTPCSGLPFPHFSRYTAHPPIRAPRPDSTNPGGGRLPSSRGPGFHSSARKTEKWKRYSVATTHGGRWTSSPGGLAYTGGRSGFQAHGCPLMVGMSASEMLLCLGGLGQPPGMRGDGRRLVLSVC